VEKGSARGCVHWGVLDSLQKQRTNINDYDNVCSRLSFGA
jgi:predicted acylesterase/phospholipase RssA